MPDAASLAMGAISGLLILGLLVGLYMLVSFIVAAYIKNVADRTKSSSWWYKFPKWLVPNNALHDWVGYPSSYSTLAGYEPSSYLLVAQDNTQSNAAITDCMLQCGDEKCAGIIFTSANTCYLVSSLDGLVPTATGNTFYVKSDNPPTKEYVAYPGKILKPPTVFPLTVAAVTSNVLQVSTATAHGLTTGMSVDITQGGIIAVSNVVTVVDPLTVTLPFIHADGPVPITGVTLTPKLSTIPIATNVASYAVCAANCVTHVDCTGFVYDNTGRNCAMYTVPIDTTNGIVNQTGAQLYVSQSPALTDSGISYY